MPLARRVGALIALGGVWLACGGDYTDDAHPGNRFNPCFENGTCNVGLACIDGLCVIPADGDAGDSPAEAGVDALVEASTDARVSADATALASAYCARLETCLPRTYAASFGPGQSCMEILGPAVALAFPGVVPPSAACVEQVRAADCSRFNGVLESCTELTGTRSAGEACNGPTQCMSGYCARLAQSDCGVCATGPVAGQDCDPSLGCTAGLYCLNAKCQALPHDGEPCPSGGVCSSGATCVTNVCTVGVGGPGSPCTPTTAGTDCYLGLTCIEAKCTEPDVSGPGEKCEASRPCARSNCINGKCVAWAKKGETCSATGTTTPICVAPLRCAADGKCEEIAICGDD